VRLRGAAGLAADDNRRDGPSAGAMWRVVSQSANGGGWGRLVGGAAGGGRGQSRLCMPWPQSLCKRE
jgi:hypothetical protein